MEIILKPIGFVHTRFVKPEDTKKGIVDKDATIEVNKELENGLICIEEFSHIVVVFYFHLSKGYSLLVRPPKHNPKNKVCGVFATRAPFRPNSIGISVVKLIKIKDNTVYIENKDILNNSPVLDIKPYLPEDISNVKTSWYIR